MPTGAAVLEQKCLDLMTSEKKDTSLLMVAMGMTSLSRSSLANFVSLSSKGGFEAAHQLINQLERDLPIKMDETHGTQWV